MQAFQSGDLESSKRLTELEIAAAPTPLAHHLLGLAHCRLGDVMEGVGYLRVAADAEPANATFQVMLARALMDAGRAEEVLERPEPPPIRCQATLDLWRVRGEAADALRQAAPAAVAWSKVTAVASQDWRAWSNLGNSLAAQCRWAEAIDAFTHAARLNGSEASVRWNLALALAAAERHEEALAALQLFEQLAGPSTESAIARARSLVAVMRFREAEEAYRSALGRSPDNRSAVRELGLLLERTNKLQCLAELLEEASSAGIAANELAYLRAIQSFRAGRLEDAYAWLESADPLEDQVRWHQLKAKVADRLGKASEAHRAALAMNRAVPNFSEWNARAKDYRTRLRHLADVLTRDAGRLPQLEKPARKMPAFLVGFPRSGTTLLDTFLMGHPETSVLEEIDLLGAAEQVVGDVAELAGCSTATLERARKAYFSELDKFVEPDFAGLVIDKLPLNLLGAHFIQAMFPGAPIVFLQRHPCDAVISGFMQGFVMNEAMASFLTIEGAADLYDAVMTVWARAAATKGICVHSVSYERLVSDPQSELELLLKFLRLPWRPEVLDHKGTAQKRGAIVTPSYDQVPEPLTTRSVGRWRRYRNELQPVLPVLLQWAKKLGYSD